MVWWLLLWVWWLLHMPKKLNIQGNKFAATGKGSINALRMNHTNVSYRTKAGRQREKGEKKKNEKKNMK